MAVPGGQCDPAADELDDGPLLGGDLGIASDGVAPLGVRRQHAKRAVRKDGQPPILVIDGGREWPAPLLFGEGADLLELSALLPRDIPPEPLNRPVLVFRASLETEDSREADDENAPLGIDQQ